MLRAALESLVDKSLPYLGWSVGNWYVSDGHLITKQVANVPNAESVLSIAISDASGKIEHIVAK